MRILLFGCGWLGKQVVKGLLNDKHVVLALTKSSILDFQHPNFQHENFNVEVDDIGKLDLVSFDKILLFLNPQQLTLSFLDCLKRHPNVLVMSSVSVYGNQGNVDEDTPPIPITSNGKHLLKIENQYPYFTFLRLGGLVGPGRNPSQFLKFKETVLLKNEVINLVHSSDVVRILAQLIKEQALPHKMNLVTPFHPKKEAFYCQLVPNLHYKMAMNETGKSVKSIYELEFGIRYKNVNLLDLKLYDETPN